MSTTLNNQKIFDIALSEIMKRQPGVVGIYLVGSFSCSKAEKSDYTDLDLGVLVDLDKAGLDNSMLKSNRYGVRLNSTDVISPFVVSLRNKKILVECILMPSCLFLDKDKLLQTHYQFAASSNLNTNPVLFDSELILYNLQKYIRSNFNQPYFVLSRLNFTFSQAYEKLIKFENKTTNEKNNLGAIWDGPLWALMSIGNLVLTVRCKTPTFRYHLVYVKEFLVDMKLEVLYYELLKIWGLENFSKDIAIDTLALTEILYDLVNQFNQITIPYYLHILKRDYWIKGIKQMIDNEQLPESGFACLFLLCATARVLEEKCKGMQIKEFDYVRNLLTKLGFDINNCYKDSIREIKNLLSRYYELMRSKIQEYAQG